MLHDETVYGPETDKFLPERFLNPGMKNPTMGFGFGRRQVLVNCDVQASEQTLKSMSRATFRQ